MQIVTLTTDLGAKDYYLAVVKAHFYNRVPGVQVVDISNSIAHDNIPEAAFVLKNSYFEFPPGTIHIAAINNSKDQPKLIVIKTNDYHFIGFDNGLFSLVLPEHQIIDVVELTFKKSDQSFLLKKVFAFAATELIKNRPLRELGAPLGEITKLYFPPIYPIDANTVRATVVYTDDRGNCILNFSRQNLLDMGPYQSFTLSYGHSRFIDRLSENYNDFNGGAHIAFFNSLGLLEIAVVNASAKNLLGLKYSSVVIIFLTRKE